MRVCIVYDCLYPWTIGGAERWYRRLAELLAESGHQVTYITRRQWDPGDEPQIPGVKVVAVSPGGPLYDDAGKRRIGPPIRFGRGVLIHLARNRSAYDVVHLSSFPYFSLIAARIALARSRVRLFVDWLELWSAEYWRGYLGGVGGRMGHAVQRACVRLTPRAFAISRHTADRLVAAGLRSTPVVLPGLYSGPRKVEANRRAPDPPVVAFVGRQIPEKRAHLLVEAVPLALDELPDLRGLVVGDGPERPRILAEIDRLGLADRVEAPGRLGSEEVVDAMRTATCLLLPSLREGYGLVVIEASAQGTPVVVVRALDSAASDLIEPGVNGFIAEDAEPATIAAAIIAAHGGGDGLRARTAGWFASHADQISAPASAAAVARAYEAGEGT